MMGYLNAPEEQDSDLKSHVMKRIEACTEDIDSSLRNTQENILQQVETLNEETNLLRNTEK